MSQESSIKMSVVPGGGSGTIKIFFFRFFLDHCSFHRIRDSCFIMYGGVRVKTVTVSHPVMFQTLMDETTLTLENCAVLYPCVFIN